MENKQMSDDEAVKIDDFAIAALPAILAGKTIIKSHHTSDMRQAMIKATKGSNAITPEDAAALAYDIARAMLAERKKP